MNEKMKILVAYDGSDFAKRSLNELPRAGFPREAEVMIVNVKERWLPSPHSVHEAVEERFSSKEPTAARLSRVKQEPEFEKIEEETSQLLEARKQLRTFFPDWKIETQYLYGSPSSRIIEKAKDWNADLVVVGAQGYANNRSVLLGSVSQKIANEAVCSVRIVRGNSWKKGAPARILIGLDGTRSAQRAAEEVAGRMWMMGSEVRLVTAKDLLGNKNRTTESDEERDNWIDSFINKAKETLEGSALSVGKIIEEGDPKRTIVRAAEEWGADCIFIGSNDTGSSTENLLLGSVATAIVARAHCTVEVVRRRR